MEIAIYIDDGLEEKIILDLIKEDLVNIIKQYYHTGDLPKVIVLEIPEYKYPLICILIVSEGIVEIFITQEVPKNIFSKDIIYVKITQKYLPQNPSILTLDLGTSEANLEISLNKISGN